VTCKEPVIFRPRVPPETVSADSTGPAGTADRRIGICLNACPASHRPGLHSIDENMF